MQYEIPYPETIKGKDGGRIPFDPAHDASHRRLLQRNIDKWKTNHPEAADATLDMIDEDRRIAVLKDASVASISRNDNGSFRVNLTPDQSKPSKGAEVASVYEPRSPGYRMTEFHPYAGWMLMEHLDDELTVARGQIAEYLRVNPWDVKVERTREGGLRLTFMKPFVYKEERDGANLQRAAAAVGHEGWWADVDAKNGTATIHPGEPATFPKTVPFPFDRLGDPETRDRMPFAMQPARPGETPAPLLVDWTQSPGLLVAGLSGGGKSVTINDVAAFSVASGSEIYVLDHATKATDFYWLRPWVAPHGWGADGLLQTCGLLKWLLDDIEGNGARARAWREHGWQNWYDDLTDEDKRKYPLRTIIVDELSQLAVGGKNATSIPKNPLPAVMERMIEQQIIALNLATLIKLTQVGRAYGYRFIIATQIASSTTGMPPALRGNLGNRLIMGARASDAQKNLVFNDASSVPDVPRNVIDEGVSKGAGMSEFEGQPPCVFKTAFPLLGSHAGTTALGEALVDRVGLPDGFTREEYLDSLDKSTPSNPDYERRIMERIRFRAQDAYRLYPFLSAMRDKLEEVEAEYGGGTTGSDPDDDGDGPTTPVTPTGKDPDGPNPVSLAEGLMDAAALARVMEGRG